MEVAITGIEKKSIEIPFIQRNEFELLLFRI